MEARKGGGDLSDLIVVGIGASAGGLEALELLFDHINPTIPVAFVIVQHLSPDFRSLMDELLARHTKLRILIAEDGMLVEPSSIYLMPSKSAITIADQRIVLTGRGDSHTINLPIDKFFLSLADDLGTRAVGIVLSGTGTDGTRGVKAIREAGGLVLVQSEESAKFDGMPKSAIQSGAADLVMAPEDMGEVLDVFAKMKSKDEVLRRLHRGDDSLPDIQRIYELLNREFGIDFSQYKLSTIARRIQRRIDLTKAGSLTEYTNGLRGDAKERSRLYNDLLIGVTKFFRDFKSFQSLDSLLRETITKRTAKGPFRVWVCACSTGEEAYSIGMMIDNILDELGISLEFKIFATDVDRHSLEIAAKGLYSKESLEVIRDSKYAGYFHETDGGFQVSTELRRSIVFAPHNALRDPPFTNLDLVSCRNFLIYLNPTAQKRVLSTLSFGLRPAGLLFLGSSENPSAVELSYQALHPTSKIYLKRDTTEQTGWSSVGFSPYAMQEPLLGDRSLKRVQNRKQTSEVMFDTNSLQDQVLSDALGIAVIINPLGFVVHSFGNVTPWISLQTGKASLAFSDLVEPSIRADAISCYMQAKLSGRSIRSIPYKEPNEQQPRLLTIRGSRYVGEDGESIVVIQFNLQSQAIVEDNTIPVEDIPESLSHHLRNLQAELSHTRESLHATIEELESSNEELQSTNEEMVASNEELQSTNEELHSVNEELYTVNAEYQKKITELSELNADFDNLLASTDIHTIFLDQSLTIRFFTPRAMELFSFAKSDVGRSIEVFKHFLKAPELIPELRRVIETGVPIEREVASLEGQYFLMRLMPYKASGKIAGVVVSLLDITARIEWDAKLKEVNHRFERAIAATRDGIWDWPDTSRGEMWWSPACYEILGYEVGEIPALYSTWMQLVHPDDQELIRQTTLSEQATCFVDLHRDFEYRMRHKNGQYRWYKHRSLAEHDADGKLIRMTGSISDIQIRKQLEESLRTQVRQRDNFLALLSHELRNPLNAITNAIAILERAKDEEILAESIRVLGSQSKHLTRLLDDLLDVSRIEHNKMELRLTTFDLRTTVQQCLDATSKGLHEMEGTIRPDIDENPLFVHADRDRIVQCQVNLLTNAIKFSKPGGIIDYTMRRQNGFAEISVKDYGVGMSRELIDHVFDLFSQGNNEPRRSESGIGVGLSLVRAITQMHGGTVEAFSTGIQSGSELILRLPLASDQMSTVSDSQSKTHSNESIAVRDRIPRGLKILIVDDLAEGRQLLARLLQLDGYHVCQAASGSEGLSELRSGEFDVALIDIGLPDMTGLELVRVFKSETDGRSSPLFVALSGYCQDSDIVASKKAGFFEHLTKPLDFNRLTDILNTLPANKKTT